MHKPCIGADRPREQGHQWAQYGLGVTYVRGSGVSESLAQACLWLNLAAAQGNELAAEKRDRIEREMTREQFAEAQRPSAEALAGC
jgi:TPR repeat protein